ncbi:hypothetical protein EWF20_07725 [Sulfolobus sp. S-194]|uniref:hypothetical protein n=1 Tax=Sulfolobus sp. S-194 TaxID=2512240 RepID=UPI0014372BDE|nr:hypothetical protein [Sulfolobus sp. S-194]QIW24046.1 hypothetical protein EWF20_07725 [Sulfolobus sp. S-194]
MQIPFGPYPVGLNLYPLALDLFIPTIFIFFAGASYRVTRYFATYNKPFIVYGTQVRGISQGEKIIELFNTFANSSRVGIKRKPATTAAGLLMHIVLVLIIFLLAQHMIFWAYYIPPYKILFPLALPESSADGQLAFFRGSNPYTSTPYPFVHDIWGPLTIILNGQYLTYLLLIFLAIYLAHKFSVVVERLSIRAGDWWFFVLLFIDVVLGFLATSHIPNNVFWYDNLLGAHILIAEIIIVTLPFTRGFHMFEFYLGKIREWYFMIMRRGMK